VLTNEVRRVYDGMIVLQERDQFNVPKLTYTRGKDLSGSLDGAGGIGGLLALSNHQSPIAEHFYFHADGNGNVTALVDTNQNVVARYLFDPFGNTLSATGPKAEINKYRFSSKEAQSQSGLVYYGYRFYEPSSQRWVNRDPIQENGGRNLYGFVVNNPVTEVDLFGLKKVYGNWCGSDWTGGQKDQYDLNGGPYLPPIDALDSACEKHDKCYFKCRQKFPCNPDDRSTCFRLCDQALTQAAYAFGGFWGKAVGAAIDRPGTRDPGPNSPCCNGSK
jgi:RHS repeat-associated protein